MEQKEINLSVGMFMSKTEFEIAYLREWVTQIAEQLGADPPDVEYDFNAFSKPKPDEQL